MAKELLKRSEVNIEDTWDLTKLYENDELWQNDIEKIKELTQKLEALEGKVGASAQNLLETLELSAQIDLLFDWTFSYAQRLFDQDQTNSDNKAKSQKMYMLAADASSRTSFIDPEILSIDEKTLEQFYTEEKGLDLYKKQISEKQRMKAHTLSAEQEKLIAMTMEMAETPSDVYSAFNNADAEFPVVKDENGEEVKLTSGRFVPMLECADRAVRENVFKEYYSTYKKHLNTIAACYNGQIKQQIFKAKVRKYPSTLEAAVYRNNVSSTVYNNLLEAVGENLDKLHRYVRLRKKCLGVDELHMYDIYTPMIPDAAKKVTYSEAKETIIKALSVLGDDYVALVKEGFSNRWVDVYENQGKRGGAYSAGVYGKVPYILMNYADSLDSMFTLAHEMGHSLHSYYSNTNQPYIYSGYKIFVAEVASTCNEILLLEYLLKNTTDKKEKAYLLNHYLDSFKGTVYRQTQFAEFEKITNEMVENGEGLNKDNLSNLYKEINEKYYGPDMISDEEIAYEWARIPHFYYNFYVYQYATSFCAAVAIAADILENGAPVVEKYKKFLSSGCSDAPVELLKIAGVDLTTKAPIQAALDKFNDIISQLEELV